MVEQLGFEPPDVLHRNRVQVTAGTQEYRNHLLLDGHRLGLRLLEQLDQPCAALQLRLGRGVQVRSEGGEGFQFPVLRQVQAETSCHLFHRLDLRRATDAGYRDTDVDSRPDTLVEQVGLQEALPSVIEMTFVGM